MSNHLQLIALRSQADLVVLLQVAEATLDKGLGICLLSCSPVQLLCPVPADGAAYFSLVRFGSCLRAF